MANFHFSCTLEVMKFPIWIRFDIAGYLSKPQHEMHSSLNWQIKLCLSKGQPCHSIGCLFHSSFYLIKFRARQVNIIILQSFCNTWKWWHYRLVLHFKQPSKQRNKNKQTLNAMYHIAAKSCWILECIFTTGFSTEINLMKMNKFSI